jgi:hypothetical protein
VKRIDWTPLPEPAPPKLKRPSHVRGPTPLVTRKKLRAKLELLYDIDRVLLIGAR